MSETREIPRARETRLSAMAPISSTEPSAQSRLSREARATLCDVAHSSIERGLELGRAPSLEASSFSDELRAPGASFVTLRLKGALRGCTGSLRATRPLVEDICVNAWRSASADPRFPPLRREELDAIDIHISVLSALTPFPVRSRQELLRKLRPGVDGLVLRDRAATATFLPAVWEQLPDAHRFLEELFAKAGLPPDHWSETIAFERYSVVEFAEGSGGAEQTSVSDS